MIQKHILTAKTAPGWIRCIDKERRVVVEGWCDNVRVALTQILIKQPPEAIANAKTVIYENCHSRQEAFKRAEYLSVCGFIEAEAS
jgi:hypothetical protein